MKVLILANNDVGLYRFRKELLQKLCQKGEVAVSCPDGENRPALEAMGCRFLPTPIDRRGINPFIDLKLLSGYFRLLAAEKPDLVLSYTIKPNIYGGIACRIKKIPYAANITGLGTAFQKKGPLKSLVTALYRVSLKKAEKVFFENQQNLQTFLDLAILPLEKTVLLPGAGVNLADFPLLEYPPNGPTRFLFLGRVMKEKGMDELFAAVRRAAEDGLNVSFDFIGWQEENYRPFMEQMQQEGLLRYHGFQRDVSPFLRKAHCILLPSYHEGMSNVLLEGAASGRPLIASDIPGCREAVEDGKTGLLHPPGNTEKLYQALCRFVSLSWEEKRQMGLAGRELVEKKFEKQKVVAETLKELGL